MILQLQGYIGPGTTWAEIIFIWTIMQVQDWSLNLLTYVHCALAKISQLHLISKNYLTTKQMQELNRFICTHIPSSRFCVINYLVLSDNIHIIQICASFVSTKKLITVKFYNLYHDTIWHYTHRESTDSDHKELALWRVTLLKNTGSNMWLMLHTGYSKCSVNSVQPRIDHAG